MKSSVAGVLVGMAMLTMYGAHHCKESKPEVKTEDVQVVEMNNGFVMGTGKNLGNSKMSNDYSLRVQTNLPDNVCDAGCKRNVNNILEPYSEELKDTTITITDGEEGVFKRYENDIYVSMNITEELLTMMMD